MSICNPVGYDRLECLYIKNSSPAFCPPVVDFCAVSPRLIHDLWGFSPPDSDFSGLIPKQLLPSLVTIIKNLLQSINTMKLSTVLYYLENKSDRDPCS